MEKPATSPWAPPSLHRSCCQAPTTRSGWRWSVATDGSTSAPGKFVEVGVPPMVQFAKGLGPEARTGCGRAGAAAAAVAGNRRNRALAPAVASLVEVRMAPPDRDGSIRSSPYEAPRLIDTHMKEGEGATRAAAYPALRTPYRGGAMAPPLTSEWTVPAPPGTGTDRPIRAWRIGAGVALALAGHLGLTWSGLALVRAAL